MRRNETTHKDDNAFQSGLTVFSADEAEAIKPLAAGALLNDTLKQEVTDITIPAWDKAAVTVKKMQQMDVGDVYHKKTDFLSSYISLRKEEAVEVLSMINNVPGATEKHDSIVNQLNLVAEKNK